jgi:hypothetical protein
MNRRAFDRHNSNFYGTQDAAIIVETDSTGLMDAFLVHKASTSLFKQRYVRVTYYTTSIHVQELKAGVSQKCDEELERQGELLSRNWLMIQRPGIHAVQGAREGDRDVSAAESDRQFFGAYGANLNTQDPVGAGRDKWRADVYGAHPLPESVREEEAQEPAGPWAHYVDASGFALARLGGIKVGQVPLAQIPAEFSYFYNEFVGKSGKRLTEEIGKCDSKEELIASSYEDQTLMVPIVTPNHLHLSCALSSATIVGAPISYYGQFEVLSKLIQKSDSSVQVINNRTGEPLAKEDIKISFVGEWIHLDPVERAMFENAEYDILWKWVTERTAVNNKTGFIHVDCKVGNNITSIYFSCRRECNALSNNWSDFSGIDGRDPILTATLRFGNDIKIRMPAAYFRTVTAQNFNSKPKGFIYVITWARDPLSIQPSGSVNTAGIKSITLDLELQPGLEKENVQAVVYIESYNVARNQKAVCGPALQQ